MPIQNTASPTTSPTISGLSLQARTRRMSISWRIWRSLTSGCNRGRAAGW